MHPLAALAPKTQLSTAELVACSDAELADLAALSHRAQRVHDGFKARLAAALAHREASGSGPEAGGVLRGTGEISAAEAERIQARGGVGEAFPEVAASLDAGEARTENVDTLAAVTAKMTSSEKKRMGALDGELAELAGRLPPETFAKNVKRKARQLKDPDPAGESESKAERQRKASGLELRRGRDGMWRLTGEFDDQRGAEINDLINQVARTLTDPSGPGPTGNDKAAALYDLVTRPAGTEDSGRPRMGIGYIVDARTLFDEPHTGSTAQTWDGDDIDPRAAERLACDAEHWGVLIDRLGQPARVGRTRRAATREQRLQLRALYPHCPLDGHTPFGWCEVHHVNVFYEDGGDTEIDNLLPVSMTWHHRIHDRGWTLKMAPDRSLKLWRPDGTLERHIPPPRPPQRE